MAINFLDNVQFNQNQLLGARLENVTSDPTSASGGDIIFNSTSGKFKYYDGTNPFNASGWIDPSLGGVSGSGTIGTIPVFVTNTTTLGNSPITLTGNRANFLDGIRLAGGNLETSVNSGTFLAVNQGLLDKDLQIGTSGQLLSSTGTQVNWIDAPVSYTKWIADGGSATTQNVNDGDTYKPDESITNPGVNPEAVTKSGTTITQPLALFTKNMTLASPSNYNTDTLLWSDNDGSSVWKVQKTRIDDIPVSAWGAATASINMDGNAIIGLVTPTLPSMAANKAYVDSSVAGGLNVKGGFNANTGITAVAGTNLYTNTAIAIGDYYTVTVAGNFFGQTSTPLTPGDSVLVQTAAASGSASITDFAVIQSDTDLASPTTVGIGNVTNDAASSNGRGLQVSYSSGTATVSLDIKSAFPALPQAVGGADNLIIWDGTSGNQGNYVVGASKIADFGNQANTFYGTTTNQTTHTFNHNLGSTAIIVQLWDGPSKQVVYATTEYTSTNQVVVTTSSSASLSCAVQKMN